MHKSTSEPGQSLVDDVPWRAVVRESVASMARTWVGRAHEAGPGLDVKKRNAWGRGGVTASCSIRVQTKRHFYPLQKESSSKARTYTSLAHNMTRQHHHSFEGPQNDLCTGMRPSTPSVALYCAS